MKLNLVVDSNVFFACFLKQGITRALFLNQRLQLFSPDYFISEISRHLNERAPFRKRIPLSVEDLKIFFETLMQRVNVLPSSAYDSFMPKAEFLAPETKDVPYLATALCLNIPIWSNDLGFKKQPEIQIYTTTELMRLLDQNIEGENSNNLLHEEFQENYGIAIHST